MTDIPFAEYGVAIFAIGTLGGVVYAFLKYLSKKDSTIEKMSGSFTEVINNHLSEDKEVKERLIASNDRLGESHRRMETALTKLTDRL